METPPRRMQSQRADATDCQEQVDGLAVLRVEVAVTPRLLRDAIRAAIIDLVRDTGTAGHPQQNADVVIVNASDHRVAPLVIHLPAETGEPGRVLVDGAQQPEPLRGIADIRKAIIRLSTGLARD